jgi:hypothetical protein
MPVSIIPPVLDPDLRKSAAANSAAVKPKGAFILAAEKAQNPSLNYLLGTLPAADMASLSEHAIAARVFSHQRHSVIALCNCLGRIIRNFRRR